MANSNNRRTIAVLITQGDTSDDLALENLVAQSKADFVPIAVTEKCNAFVGPPKCSHRPSYIRQTLSSDLRQYIVRIIRLLLV